MRDIKFRAWDGVRYRHWAHWEIAQDQDESDEVFWGCAADGLEQYTGLKDKNGKEIYEGDIVTTAGYRVGVYVRFYRGAFYPFVMVDDGDLNWFPEESAVIGNIHENPDLLK